MVRLQIATEPHVQNANGAVKLQLKGVALESARAIGLWGTKSTHHEPTLPVESAFIESPAIHVELLHPRWPEQLAGERLAINADLGDAALVSDKEGVGVGRAGKGSWPLRHIP